MSSAKSITSPFPVKSLLFVMDEKVSEKWQFTQNVRAREVEASGDWTKSF
jgi:hypothetical protein